MNKAEKEKLIEKVSVICAYGAETEWGKGFDEGVNACLDILEDLETGEPEITTEQAWNKIAESRPNSPADIANTCNTASNVMNCSGNIRVKNGKLVTANFEKEEVELPKAVAEYLDGFSDTAKNADSIIYYLITDTYEKKYSDRIFRLADALRYGYKEKEPLYIMPVPYSEDAFYFKDFDGEIRITERLNVASNFTESEINEYFPKIKEFAEEVEE